ncbi:hypothetical protein [Methanospirillum sp.]|uniref:hypothetical protein n=1 Tax=Methanospirillum sp. TaxID=45200 RepID=UPI002984EE23|nr:hypothetical protein [Methanospirillum sp.]
MDDSSKEQFKWRFWHLTVILNGIVVFIALIPIAYFIFPEEYRVPGAVISLILAIITAVIFTKNYYKTKTWLSEQT